MISQHDTTVLRDLAKQVAELASHDANRAKIANWTRLNALDSGVPAQVLTHLWPLAWTEILPDEALTCVDPAACNHERHLRRKIWIARTLDNDDVIEPVIHYPQTAWIEPYGDLHVSKRWADGREEGAHEFVPVIVEKSDIEKIGDSVLHTDAERDVRARDQALEVFSPILTVVKQPHYFAAKVADEFSWLRGLENTYIDIIEDPHWVHEALQRIADNVRRRFLRMEEAGVWGVAEKSHPLGSAGLRFSTDIPDWRSASDPTAFAPTLSESWGFTCAEVFNCVSPVMHDEFSFEYDRQLMGLFRYINVGCCETLDTKAGLIRSLPNARKISVSEWCDVAAAAEAIGPRYVYSYRAAGVPFIQEPWDIDTVRDEISRVLDATRGMPVEIVLNIGGTLGSGDPVQKLVDWQRTVKELIHG